MPRTLHLIRHGQSTYNAACAISPWSPPLIYDAPLSPRGVDEVADLRTRVVGLGVDVVVASPLTRAVQTALGAFGQSGLGAFGQSGLGAFGQSGLGAFGQSGLGAFGTPQGSGEGTPIIINPLIRECLEASGDVGRAPKILAAEFPMLCFDHLDNPWWHTTSDDPLAVCLEPEATLRARIDAFLVWVSTQPFRTMAVIGHGTFFNHLTGTRLDNCGMVTITL